MPDRGTWWTALGVAYARCSRIPDAGKDDLLNAKKLGYELATLNLSILDGSPSHPAATSTMVDVEMFSEEQIENLSPFQARDKFSGKPLGSFQIAANSRSSLPGVVLSRQERAGAQMVTLHISRGAAEENSTTYILLRTGEGYAGQLLVG